MNDLIPVLSAEDVNEIELQKRADAVNAENALEEEAVTSLVQFIKDKWEDAKKAKQTAETAMLSSIRQRRGEYDPEKLNEIKAVEQPEIFMNITDTKCRSGIAWVKDILFQPGKRMFGIDPTPLPELPDFVMNEIRNEVLQQYFQIAVSAMQQTGQISTEQLKAFIVERADAIKDSVHKAILKKAKELSKKVEDKVDDDFTEGGFYTALDSVIDDIISLKAGILKGPVFRKGRVRTILQDEMGRMTRAIEERIVPQYERRSPFAIFPSPRSLGVNDGYLFDLISLRPKDLHNLIGMEGYNEDEIRAVLGEFDTQPSNEWLQLSQETKDGLGESEDEYPEENIYCLEFWGDIPGDKLEEWGLEVEDKDDEYGCCLWMIGDHVIKVMFNFDLLGRKPYSKTSFQVENDSFWGRDVPETIEDCQQVCNATARSTLANIGLGALPQVEVNTDRLAPGASQKTWPGKTWPTTDEQMAAGSRAVNFYQPTMVTDQLMNVYFAFSKIADEHSGIPAYAHGNSQVGGAGNTASGLNMLISQAARGIRAVVRNIDRDIISERVAYHYDYLLDNEEIFGLIGDYKISAKGTSALLAMEQQAIRKVEFLNMTNNPVDLQLVGPEKRREQLADVAKEYFGIDLDDSPVPVFNAPLTNQSPQAAPTTLDNAGNPTQGTDTREYNPEAV